MTNEPAPTLTAHEVHSWFVDAVSGSRSSPPTLEACGIAAFEIERFRHTGHTSRGRVENDTPTTALKHARLLLRHLPTEIARIDAIARSLRPKADTNYAVQSAWRAARQSAGLLRGGQEFVEEMVKVMVGTDLRPPNDPPWHRTAMMLSLVAQKAWMDSGLRAPRATRAGQPLHLFVRSALAYVEDAPARPEESVADALRIPTWAK